MIIELLSRRAEMFEFEFDEVLFALKYNRPAFVPLFQLPPTYNTRSATRRQSLLRLNYTLQNAGGLRPPDPRRGLRGYASHRRRAEMPELEFDEVLLAMKYNRPALVPLIQWPPTHNTRQPEDDHM